MDTRSLCAVISMLICYSTYSVVGYFGYATFGSGNVPSDILQGYTDKSAMVTVGIIAIAVKNFTTYPIVLYCGRDALLAILVPDISPIINLMGSLSAMFIFILPGICLLQSVFLRDPELYFNKNCLLIIFAILLTAIGAFVCGVIFIEALEDLQKTPAKPPLVTGFRQLRQSLCV